jgi:hypothetical protein
VDGLLTFFFLIFIAIFLLTLVREVFLYFSRVVVENSNLLPWLGLILVAALLSWITLKILNKKKNERINLRLIEQQRERDFWKSMAIREERATASRNKLKFVASETEALIKSLPTALYNSEKELSKAKKRFEQRSYYPFWDAIGESTESLKKYQQSIHKIDQFARLYYKQLQEHKKEFGDLQDTPVPSFPVRNNARDTLRNGSATASRISQLYDVAHRDFEFATIYANWRTNKTLVAGFQNLSDGLASIRNDLGSIELTIRDGFEASIMSARENREALDSSLSRVAREVSETLNSNTDRLEAEIFNRSIRESRSYDEAVLKMKNLQTDWAKTEQSQNDEMIRILKNIQNGREEMPFFNSPDTRYIR